MKVPILLPNIFNHPFTYESDQSLEIGDYVLVPFGKSKITGVVWDDFEKKNNKNFQIEIFQNNKSNLKNIYNMNKDFNILRQDIRKKNSIFTSVIKSSKYNSLSNNTPLYFNTN